MMEGEGRFLGAKEEALDGLRKAGDAVGLPDALYNV